MQGLAILMLLISMALCLATMVFWIWTLIDCVTNKRLPESQKIIWALVIFFVGIIGSLIYLFVGRSPKVYVPVQPHVHASPLYEPLQVEPEPVENYHAYQEGYRVRESPRTVEAGATISALEELPAEHQVQHEHIQISYPE
ncbi:MAG TPA: PLD nuclease N-terminal domain-containing protein [Ktedonobacteraceae bacterium]